MIGEPILRAAFAEGGFWTGVFDPDATRRAWEHQKGAPDMLAVAHLLPPVLQNAV